MNIKKLLVDFVTVFAVTLIVSVVVTFLWSLSVYGASAADWETSFRLAVIFAVLLTWMETRRSRGNKNAV
jgi:hypothetical protein